MWPPKVTATSEESFAVKRQEWVKEKKGGREREGRGGRGGEEDGKEDAAHKAVQLVSYWWIFGVCRLNVSANLEMTQKSFGVPPGGNDKHNAKRKRAHIYPIRNSVTKRCVPSIYMCVLFVCVCT